MIWRVVAIGYLFHAITEDGIMAAVSLRLSPTTQGSNDITKLAPYRKGPKRPGNRLFASEFCITPDDFDFSEVQDKVLAKIAGFHGILPNMNLVHRLIVSYFRGITFGRIWGHVPPEVDSKMWRPLFTLAPR